MRGGVSKLEWAGDADYLAQATIDLYGGDYADCLVRYVDPDNYYAVRLGKDTGGGTGPIQLLSVLRGYTTTLAQSTYSTASSVDLKVKVDGTTLKAWVGQAELINTNGLSDLPAGGVALAAEKAKFSAVKVFYDTNSNESYDSGTDKLVVNETFNSTALTLNADHTDQTEDAWDANGNLRDDGTYKYTYDAWNRLVKVTAKADTGIVIQEAAYDADGRRVKKVVTNSGDHDGTTVYYYHGQQIIETRDGSGNLTMQVYHGTQYIDEIVGLRLPYGRVYVHQDANWNVIALTDLKGAVLERYYYSPYGELEVVANSYFGDYNGDGFVNATDAASLCSSGCTCSYGTASGDCRVFDFDADGDLDATDQQALADLYTGRSADLQNRRVPSTSASPLGNPFAHQGLVLDPEIHSYQNRARQYNPQLKRFMQRDPLAAEPAGGAGYQDGLSAYQYLKGNSNTATDPSGNTTCSVQTKYICTKKKYNECNACLSTTTVSCPAGRSGCEYKYGTWAALCKYCPGIGDCVVGYSCVYCDKKCQCVQNPTP